jgi:hypothetical protein
MLLVHSKMFSFSCISSCSLSLRSSPSASDYRPSFPAYQTVTAILSARSSCRSTSLTKMAWFRPRLSRAALADGSYSAMTAAAL